MLKPYTVVLLKPDYMCRDVPYGQEIYIANMIMAEGAKAAFKAAQAEAFAADTENGDDPQRPDDYALCVVFEGHCGPRMFGWMT